MAYAKGVRRCFILNQVLIPSRRPIQLNHATHTRRALQLIWVEEMFSSAINHDGTITALNLAKR